MIYRIEDLLRGNPYPGRGIIIGAGKDSNSLIIIYFIMGRSENSRNRFFEKTVDGIRTAVIDPKKMIDPSLIIYHPVRSIKTEDGILSIVTNGDQTDTIREFLEDGKPPIEALLTRKYEPDAPNYTARISGIVFPCGKYMLSILKAQEQKDICCERFFYYYDDLQTELGHYISTYKTDGDPLPPFVGEPIPVSLSGSADLKPFAKRIWDSLNEQNKISLYISERNIKTGDMKEHIVNRNCKDNK